MKRLFTLIFLLLITSWGWGDAIRPPSGFLPPSTGGSSSTVVVADITGQTEVMATYGQDITAGDALVARQYQSYDYGVGSYTSYSSSTITGGEAVSYIAWAPNGKSVMIHRTTPKVLDFIASTTVLTNERSTVGHVGPACAFTPQGDKVFNLGDAANEKPIIWDVTYNGDGTIATFTLSASSPADLGPSGATNYSAAFNPQGSVVAAINTASPHIHFWRRMGDDTFVKLANPDTLPGDAGTGPIVWTPSGKQVLFPNKSAITVYTVDYDTYTVTKAANLPGTAGWTVALNPSGSLAVVGDWVSTDFDAIKIEYDANDLIATTTLLTDPPNVGTGGNTYQCIFIENGRRLIVQTSNSPYAKHYVVNYDSGTASFTEALTPEIPQTNAPYARADFGGSHYVCGGSSTAPYVGVYNYYLTTYTANASDTLVYKPQSIVDYWSSYWFGYAKESGTAGSLKTVIKFPEGY